MNIYECKIKAVDGSEISVAQYIIGDLNSEGLSLYNDTYRAIVQEYSDNINQTDFDPLKHFTQFEDGNIVSSVADIVSEKYELEKIWNETSESRIESEYITKLLNNYKLRRIVIRIKQIDKKIAELTRESEPDHNEIFEWMKKKMALNELRSLLVNAMGRSAVQ